MTSLQLYYINILFFLSFLYNREYKIINIKMQYSTIQEAYNIDSLKPIKKSTKSSSQSSNNSPPYNIENNSVASNKESVNYNSKGGSCSPIQAPTYTIPISGDCKKERDAAMKTFIEENFKTEPVNSSSTAGSSGVSSGSGMGNGGENGSSNRQDNIMPFYDEDMEQYFDINNLTDEVGYKSTDGSKVYNYMPNHNKNSYTNNNTGEYSNNNNISKNGVNLLNTNEYNLSTEERKKAQEALAYLKSIEDKINSDENRGANETLDKIRRSNNTGPGGFGKATFENQKDSYDDKKLAAAAAAAAAIQMNSENENKLLESIKENKKTENIFNMIINIFIFVFIGAFIILICDYITELAIQIGSTKTSNVLEPYIKYNIYMQHHFQHLQNMQNMPIPNMQMPNMQMPMPMPNMPIPQNQGYAYNIPEMPSPMGIAK